MRIFRVLCVLTMAAAGWGARGQAKKPVTAVRPKATVALTPPMGWNSWDSYGLKITEPEFRANVDVLAKVLKPYGWQYAVIDEGWFMEKPTEHPKPSTSGMDIDAYGRYIPVPARFPSSEATRGFEAIGKDVHAAGLKFGVHIVRGIPRMAVLANTPIEGSKFHAVDAADQSDACSWDPTNWGVNDNAAGQAYYDSLIRQFAGWGVDLLKVDCIADRPYKVSEIRMIRRAIDRVGRPMVLSLSPGPTSLSHAVEVGGLAQMWRISNDEWDLWHSDKEFPQGVGDQFARTAAWARYARPGNWPDADMLPLGELKPSPGWGEARTSRLTRDEQKTQMTLWSVARSPLILGANLTMLDDFTTSLLTNRELISIDQTAVASRQFSHEGNIVAWTADLPRGGHALALFNVGDGTAILPDVEMADYGLGKGRFMMTDVWAKKPLGGGSGLQSVQIAAHGCILWTLAPIPGKAAARPAGAAVHKAGAK